MLRSLTRAALLLALCLLLPALRAAGQARIEFATLTHDFGTISENDGDASFEFTFTNTGDKPLMVLRAQASCGCTTPEYTRKPLRPGESGSIKVTYHAKGRPGTFEKSIHVFDNSEPGHKTVLVITGNVLSTRSPEESFAHRMGAGLRVKNRALNFFDVYPNRANRTRTMEVYNEGDAPIQLSFRGVPKHLVVECDPQVIQPKKEGKVLVTFLTSRCADWGLHKDKFEVFVKGKEAAMKDNTVAVSADIWEDFSALSRKERDAAPSAEVSGTVLDFGEDDRPRSRTVTVTNTGKGKLQIRKVQNDMPKAFITSLSSATLKPGEQATLTVRFVPDECPMQTVKHHLTLISNDPDNSRIIINMTATK